MSLPTNIAKEQLTEGSSHVADVDRRVPRPRVGVEYFMVKDWNFGAANLPNVFEVRQRLYRRAANQEPGQGDPIAAVPDRGFIRYSHFNQRNAGDTLYPGAGEGFMWASAQANAYQFPGQPSVTDVAGIAGQDSPNPDALFNNHVLVKVNNVLYDPSYGKTYTSIQDFENNGVAGYVFHMPITEAGARDAFPGNNFDFNQNGTPNENVPARIFFFRQNDAGQDDLI